MQNRRQLNDHFFAAVEIISDLFQAQQITFQIIWLSYVKRVSIS